MGLLEELIILAKDAIDEANQRGKKPAGRPAPTPPDEDEDEELRQEQANRAMQARLEQEQSRREAAERRAEEQRQQQAQERERQRQRQAAEAARNARAVGVIDPRRIVRLVHQPGALREMMVLREILDQPLARRRRH